jgi:hypothetical protein
MALNLNPVPGDLDHNLLWKILASLREAVTFLGVWAPASDGLLHVTLAEGLNSTDDKVSVERAPGAPNWTAVQVSVASAVNLVPERNTRRYVKIHNRHATVSVFVGPTAGVLTTTGYEIQAGEDLKIDTTAAVYAIPATGSVMLSILEVFDN